MHIVYGRPIYCRKSGPTVSNLLYNKLLGNMPVKFIGNYFVTFVYRYQVLGFIGNYAVCELPVKSKGKCFLTDI